jgi:hypothetical protein
MLSKIKKATLILALAALCAAGQAQTKSWARGNEGVSGPGTGYTNKANAEPQGMGSAKHDADQTAQKCKQFSNTKDPVSQKAKGCDKIVEH